MGGTDTLIESPAAQRSTRDVVWIVVAALLAGLFAIAGSSAPAAARRLEGVCDPGTTSHTVALPSGRAQTFCTAPGAGPVTISSTPSITLSKTVATADECGTQSSIVVPSATTIYYCYTVTNTGEVTVSTHDLDDDQLGVILDGYDYELPPGGSTFVTTSAVIGTDTVNIATWTASDGVDSAIATSSATVTVGSPPGAPGTATASASEGEATVGWDAATDDGTHPVTGYTVTPYIAGVAQTPVDFMGTGTSGVVTGLVNGQTYTFKVAANSDAGTGAQTADSNAVTPQWWLPWSSGPKAVDELFTWFTGVAPTAAEKSGWLAQLDGGKLPGDLVAALRVGPDATNNVDPVVRLYSAYLQRIPDKNGLNFWIKRRRAGWKLARISSNFAASNEFKTKYGTLTNRQFVTRLYTDVLGRTADTAGVNYWTNQLDTHKKTRGQVMLNFSDSSEYKRKQANNVTAAVIFIYLRGKTPTVAERDAFVAALVGGEPLTTLVRAQIHLPAFASRAG